MAPLVFIDINPSVTIYRPAESEKDGISEKQSSPFKTIILLPWMAASYKSMFRYASIYHELFPMARIFILTSDRANFFGPNGEFMARLKPAVALLQDDLDGILVHMFSNGGANTYRFLSETYRAVTGSPIPTKAMILDSAPGLTTFKNIFWGFYEALPSQYYIRLPGIVAIALFTSGVVTLSNLSPDEDALNKNWKFLNNHEQVDARSPRLYIYSKGDSSIDWRDVERHASEAQKLGWDVVTRRIEGSRHVGHMKKDPDTYWSAIRGICKL